jgi:hypothetical protein
MKVYEIQWSKIEEKSWVSAHTAIHAIQVYCSETSTDLGDFDDTDDIVELPEDKWATHTIDNSEDGEETETFAEFMARNPHVPALIAETIHLNRFQED